MERHDSTYWALFENRPAKERTSALVPEHVQKSRDGNGWRQLPRTGRPVERIKC